MSKESHEEYIMSEEFREWLTELLSHSSPTISFVKKDGTTRIMKCTRDITNIPEEYHPKNETKSGTSIRVFDLEKNEWRSFIAENITAIEYEQHVKDIS